MIIDIWIVLGFIIFFLIQVCKKYSKTNQKCAKFITVHQKPFGEEDSLDHFTAILKTALRKGSGE